MLNEEATNATQPRKPSGCKSKCDVHAMQPIHGKAFHINVRQVEERIGLLQMERVKALRRQGFLCKFGISTLAFQLTHSENGCERLIKRGARGLELHFV